MPYTSLANIENELGMSFTASTTPTSTTVTAWLTEIDSEIDVRTNTVWSSTAVSSEYYDYDGSGIMRLNQAPIIAVSELLMETNGINATTAGWGTLTEGRTSSGQFIVYKDEAEIHFHGTPKPTPGFQNLCITYTHGYATTPTKIQRLATLIGSQRVINTVVSNTATNEGGAVSVGTISVADPSDFGNKRISNMASEIQTLIDEIGSFKTFRLNKRG